jgi:hypothetical protein
MHFTWCIKTVLEISFTWEQKIINVELSCSKMYVHLTVKTHLPLCYIKLSFLYEEQWRMYYQVDLDTIFQNKCSLLYFSSVLALILSDIVS